MDRSKTPRELHAFDCIEAPCVDECPVDQKVPQYMNAVRDGDLKTAVQLAREDNPMPAILGRVCDHTCENTCIRTHLDQPLAIRHMKRFIMDHEEQPVVLGQKPAQAARVAIVGAGPAGIAAAHELGYAGFGVTVFEAHPYSGGMVGGAIPTYRLPRSDIDQDMAVLEELGVEVRYGQKAGVDFTIDELRGDGYIAVIIAVGAQLAKQLDLPGEDADGVIDGITFLRTVREGHPMPIGSRVGVVGAGDTAMDCVRTARRVGADEVNLIYRRTVDQMPADPEEIHASIEEGIKMVELATPTALTVDDGRLAALVCTRTEYRGERDSSGRNIPFEIPDSEFEIELDTLILAISQHSVLDFFGDEVPALTRRGYIDVDPVTFESSVAGVYAAGDVAADGPSSIVKAAADGKALADAVIAKHTSDTPTIADPAPAAIDLQGLIVRRARREYRTPVQHTPLDEREGFDETVLGFTPEEAKAEAARCPRLSRDLQPLCRRVPKHGADDISDGSSGFRPAVDRACFGHRGGRIKRIAAFRRRPDTPDRRAYRLLQRVRQLRHIVSHFGVAVSGQAPPLPGSSGLRGRIRQRLHDGRRLHDRGPGERGDPSRAAQRPDQLQHSDGRGHAPP